MAMTWMRIGAWFVLVVAVRALPASAQTFTCGADHFGTDDGCDCGCGVLDPDCGAAPVDLVRCEYSGCDNDEVPSGDDAATCVADTCGNGYRGGDEACDDGDDTDEGGCSADCDFVTPGYLCGEGAEGCRRERCGDAIRTIGERCDDGNTNAGDGCSPDCTDEPGWVCYQGAPCRRTFCGDFWAEYDTFTRTGETCDDGNQDAGDGCDNCEAEPGWYCSVWESFCMLTDCGNGQIEGDVYYGLGETCDDGNDEPNDGCDECVAAPGYICWNGPCHLVDCGDGFIDNDGMSSFEQCDDGNDASDDGCSSTCALEPGFDCYSRPPGEPCVEIVCGDGIQSYDQMGYWEACDDGNDEGGDGCAADCSYVENGFICDMPGQPCREPVCGDGFIDLDPFTGALLEECDDGNDQGGDGCDAECEREQGFECPVPGEPCSELPDGWRCSLSFFDNNDGCDCGCGLVDPDCGGDTVASCAFNHCFEDPWIAVDPCDIAACVTEEDASASPCPTSEGEGEPDGNDDDGEGDDLPEPIGCGALAGDSAGVLGAWAALFWCAASVRRRARRR